MNDVKKNILVVDDEKGIIEFIETYLSDSGYEVFTAYTGKEALEIFYKEKISMILLDLMLHDISGEEICKTIRKTSNVPIIMLTAKVTEESVLLGLDIGADDYITKPFSPRELVARIGVLFRRIEGCDRPVSNFISYNDRELIIDTVKKSVMKNGEILDLTSYEYKILSTLAKSPGRIFSRDNLINQALGSDFYGFDRTIDVHIKNLRQKIESDVKNSEYIVTVYGVGYKFGGK